MLNDSIVIICCRRCRHHVSFLHCTHNNDSSIIAFDWIGWQPLVVVWLLQLASVHECSVLRFTLMQCIMLHKCTQCGDLLVTFKNVLIYCSGLQMYVIISRRFRKSVFDKYACAVHTQHIYLCRFGRHRLHTIAIFKLFCITNFANSNGLYLFASFICTDKKKLHGIAFSYTAVVCIAYPCGCWLFSFVFMSFSKACMHVQRNDYHFHLGVFVAPRTRFGRFVRSFGGGVYVLLILRFFMVFSAPPFGRCLLYIAYIPMFPEEEQCVVAIQQEIIEQKLILKHTHTHTRSTQNHSWKRIEEKRRVQSRCVCVCVHSYKFPFKPVLRAGFFPFLLRFSHLFVLYSVVFCAAVHMHIYNARQYI